MIVWSAPVFSGLTHASTVNCFSRSRASTPRYCRSRDITYASLPGKYIA